MKNIPISKIIPTHRKQPHEGKLLRVLMLEDSEKDARLILRRLKKDGYNPVYERIKTPAAMKKALKEKQWDIILCDYKMPKFSGPSAITVLKKANIDIPLIVVAGAIGEATAVKCMRLGAHDYIIKGNMSRLCPAIARELEEAEVRNKEKHMEEKLRYEEQRFRAFVENSPDMITLINLEGTITYVNPAVEKILGFKPEERIGANGFELIHPDDMKLLADSFNSLSRDTNAPIIQGEMRLRHKDGSWCTLEAVGSNLVNDNLVEVIVVNYRDITERKQIEYDLRVSEENFRHSFDDSPLGVRISTIEGETIYANRAILDIYGYDSVEELKKTPLKERYTPGSYAEFQLRKGKRLRGEFGPSEYKISIVRKNGEIRHLYVFRKEIFWNGKKQSQVIYQDITERRQAEEKLRETLESLRKSNKTTIQVLGIASEARDPYTAGHQKRVADLARTIATEMKLPHDTIEGIRMAGSIHDIGKLSLPAEILSKPTKLTNIESSLIKEHPQIGYEMLKDVESPWPLAQIVHQHHERINGSGYPKNLKGDEILMESRILAVADVVEAMASHRPYRPTLGIDTALEEIVKNKGILYDDAVADTCLKLFREKGYQLA